MLLGEAPVSRIEIFLTRRDNSLFLHFFNHAFEPGESLPFRGQNECYQNVRVALSKTLASRITSIELLPQGKRLEFDSADKEPGFVLPQLDIYSLARIMVK